MPNHKALSLCYTLIIVVMLAACTGQATPTPEPSPTATPEPLQEQLIVLGDISDDPGEVIDGTQPLADYLAEQLSEFGIVAGQVRIAADADEMTELLTNGEVDIYFDSVYPATLISDASGAQPFLRRWRYGVETYYSVIFAKTDGDIKALEDLPGHMIAFDNPFSTSGYLLPAVHLLEAGFTLVGKESFEDPVGEDEIGFVFSYDDENTLLWVTSGQVAAGATDDYNFDVAFEPETREELVALATTGTVPRQVAVARPGIDPELLEAIKQILITAHESEAGQAALEPFQTTRFDEFPESIEAAQERMREMMEIVNEIDTP